MRSRAPSAEPGLGSAVDRFKRWKPAAQAEALEALRRAELADWHPFYCKNLGCNGQPHVWPADERTCKRKFGHEWHLFGDTWACADPRGKDDETYCGVTGTLLDDWAFGHSRRDQRPPRWTDEWLTLFLRGGRGSGKTRTGSEITNRVTKLVPLITLIGATGPDLRNIMVEGESGILATSPPGERPEWEPSKKLLTWPNGCKAQGYSAEEPDRLRGQNSGYVWGDEPAHWTLVQESWDNMLFGLRKGDYPKILATSTPKPIPWVKEQIADPYTVDRVVSTYANMSNLSPVFYRTVVGRFEGSRTGRQELHGEVLEDVEGSLWKHHMIQYVDEAPEDLQRIVVGVDPAGSTNKKSDLTGIIVVGIDRFKNIYVLGDYTGKFTPGEWGTMANRQYQEFQADHIVAEKNFGADMVTYVLENTFGKGRGLVPPIKAVHSRRGKEIRAEPVVALYEKGKVFHVGEKITAGFGLITNMETRGSLSKLDDELTTWVPGVGSSPNRLDALVHAITEIGNAAMASQFADPRELLKNFRTPSADLGGRRHG